MTARELVPPALVAARRRLIRTRQLRRPFSAVGPFSEAYLEKRDHELAAVAGRIADGTGFDALEIIGNGDYARLDERIVEYAWALSRLRDHPGARLLDVGCVLNQEFCAPLLRTWFEERWYLNIVHEPLHDSGAASMIVHDVRDCPLPDGWFDAISCVSTLEHVGMDNSLYTEADVAAPSGEQNLVARAEPAVRELRRLLAPGGTLLVTVPFGRAEDRAWFQVFSPEGIERLQELLGPQGATVEVFRVGAERGWERSTPADARNAVYGEGAVASAAVACIAYTKPA